MDAKSFNEWRVIPRILVSGYVVLVADVSTWFMLLTAPTPAQSAFVSVVALAAAGIFNFYVKSGNAD